MQSIVLSCADVWDGEFAIECPLIYWLTCTRVYSAAGNNCSTTANCALRVALAALVEQRVTGSCLLRNGSDYSAKIEAALSISCLVARPSIAQSHLSQMPYHAE